MLTVDTHFTDGYVCELCQNQYDEQYSNVIACSSRQVSEFLDWIKQQDFMIIQQLLFPEIILQWILII